MKQKILSKSNETLGNELAKLRIKENLSQEELSHRLQLAGCDISRATLSKIELGKRQVYATEIVYFAKVFNVNVSSLLENIE